MGNLSILSSNCEKYEWSVIWANGLVDKFSLPPENRETVVSLIVELLKSTELGNSCISISQDQASLFSLLVTDDEKKIAPFFFDGENLYLHRHFNMELNLSNEVKRLVSAESSQIDVSEFLELLDDEHQKKAMQVVALKNLTLITGGPGTGKTYTLARIIAAISKSNPNAKIAMSAPTGKASQRMQEALQKAFSDEVLVDKGLVTEQLKNLVPTTIHRLIGIGHTGKPSFNKEQPLPYDVLVVDEVSMLDLGLAYHLLSAIKSGAKVIMLGDSNQLASVDVGYVLSDLKESDLLADSQVNLVTSRRFSDDALIGKLAKYIQSNHELYSELGVVAEIEKSIVVPSLLGRVDLKSVEIDAIYLEYKNGSKGVGEYLSSLYEGYVSFQKSLKQYVLLNEPTNEEAIKNITKSFDEYRILTATKHGDLGLNNINHFIKGKLIEALRVNEVGGWYLGRPVMVLENNYKLGLSNGDIGITLKHRTNIGEYEVYFPSSEKWIPSKRLPSTIQTAFALTIHKSQGSEFDHVAVIIDESSEKLLSQELIYTAITRAKKVVSLLVEPKALGKSIKTKTIRKSGLLKRLG